MGINKMNYDLLAGLMHRSQHLQIADIVHGMR